MSRIAISLVALAIAGAQPALAAGTTPPIQWLPVIKDALRAELKNPEYVSFGRIFFAEKRTDDGAVPICGFVSFKQNKKDHATKENFFGLLTPPDNGKTGAFASIKLGATADQTKDIDTTCKNYGVN